MDTIQKQDQVTMANDIWGHVEEAYAMMSELVDIGGGDPFDSIDSESDGRNMAVALEEALETAATLSNMLSASLENYDTFKERIKEEV